MKININGRERLVAATIHFLATFLIASIAAALIFLVWFPGALAKMMGGAELFLLVICSDLVLGPLISLVIFSKKKTRRNLILDYLIVCTIQLAALIYGVSVVASSRPVFVVFCVRRFEVVTALELDDSELAAATDTRYRVRSWWGPQLVAIQMPTDTKEREELLFSAFKGKDVQLMPKYYRSYDIMIDEVKRKSESLGVLVSRRQEKTQDIEVAIKELGRAADSLRWLPVHHRFGFWTALVDAKSGYPVKYLPIDPY